MTDNVVLALIATVPPTLAAVGGLIVVLKNATKVNEIHTLVNGNLAAAIKKIHELELQINELELQLDTKIQSELNTALQKIQELDSKIVELQVEKQSIIDKKVI